MVVVKDLVRDSGSVDTAFDLDKGIAVGCSDVGGGEAAVVGKGQLTLEEAPGCHNGGIGASFGILLGWQRLVQH